MAKNPYELPRVFGKYYLLELIAQGGMAEVFKAKMFGVEGFEKIVAIKKILQEVAEDGDFIEMFIDEAKIAVQLQHPNVVQILELGKIDDAYFIAMELVNGKDLKTVRKRLKRVDLLMPVEQSVYTIAQVCDGLDYAHRKTDEKMNPLNIIHRDISPQNMIVSYEGTVKLIDFGIAKAKSKSTKTQAGMLKGKFAYMSPEQVAGMAIDRRSDIFSLGVVLFEMLTGKRLFLGKNDVATLDKIRKAEVPKPSVFNSAVTPELDRIVLKALAKDRDDRYQWASEFAEDLKQFNFRSERSFTRQDMMSFMREFFVEEIEDDLEKLDGYSRLEIPEEMRSGLGGSRVQTRPRSDFDDDDDFGSAKNRKGPALFITMFLLMVALLGTAGYFMFFATNNTTLIVDANVPAALITFDEGTMYEKRCSTPCTLEGVLDGDHTIDVNKDGYLSLTKPFSIKDGEQKTMMLQLYKPGEQKTMLTVKSTPDGAEIFINGKKEEDVTPAIVNVPVGIDIVLRTEKSGYKSTEKSIGKLTAENNREVNFVMKALRGSRRRVAKRAAKKKRARKYKSADAGYISINSKPWANIYIDGKFVKASPIVKYPLKPGRHKIHFKNPKFKINKVFPVTIKPKQSQRMIKNF